MLVMSLCHVVSWKTGKEKWKDQKRKNNKEKQIRPMQKKKERENKINENMKLETLSNTVCFAMASVHRFNFSFVLQCFCRSRFSKHHMCCDGFRYRLAKTNCLV